MKHSTAVMVLALAWGVSTPVRAQQPAAPPQQTPTTPQPQAPPAGPPSPAPTEPGAQPNTPPIPPGTTPPAPPPPTQPSQPASQPSPPAATAPASPETAAQPAPPPAPAAAVAPTAATPVEPDTAQAAGEVKSARPLLGLAVGTPDTGGLPGRFRPAYGVSPKSPSDFKFDFHGYLNVPLRFGINERENPYETQYETVFHGPPLVPDDFERFEHTGLVPQPWVQLNFSYGNSVVVGTVVIAARSVSNASGFFNPPTQLGINDAFLTFKPKFGNVDVEFDVGGFANRYGSMGDYDTGRYDTPVIARLAGVGYTGRIGVPLPNELVFLAEQGITGQWDRAPLGVEPAGWNGFTDPNVGTSFAHHAHIGLAYLRRGQIGLHFASAFTRDDRTAPQQPDGNITVIGADVNANLAQFGRIYVAGAYTDASDARGVSSVIRVLNTAGGPGLMREYLGRNSGGNGSLFSMGAQYDVSIGEIVRFPAPFSGYGPDVYASLFGLYTHVTSDEAAFDGVDKLKYGGEVTYSALSWLAFSGRYDRVVANTDDDTQTFAVISPRIIFRSDFNSQDQVTLQYSRWFYGSGVTVRNSYDPNRPADPSVVPDEQTISLTASMWW